MNNLSNLIDEGNVDERSKFIENTNNKIDEKTLLSNNNKNGAADNTTVLIGIIVLVGLVTLGQYFAAYVSHSLALTADAIQNTVDLTTYIVNLYVEYVVIHSNKYGTSSRTHIVRLNMGAAIFSLIGLCATNVDFISTSELRTPEIPSRVSPVRKEISN